ncbi:MAG: hypothetical protein ACT4PU_05410 [Planctomycetota bacterium]
MPVPTPVQGTGALPLLVAPASYQGALPFSAATVNCTFSVPLAQAWQVPLVNGRPALTLLGAQRWSFRALDTWPNGAVKWALGTAAVPAGTGVALPTLTVVLGVGQSGQAQLASTVGNRIFIDTGVLKAEISKTAFNLLDRVIVDGVQIVAPGTSPGIYAADAGGAPLKVAATTVVSIEENGPAGAVVRADGKLVGGAVSVVDFTCRLAFVHGSRDVRITLTVRNANIERPQHVVLDSLELAIRAQPGGLLSGSFALPEGAMDLLLPTGSLAYAYQAYSSAPTSGATGSGPAYLPHLPKTGPGTFVHEGYSIVKNGVTLHAGDKTAWPRNPFAALRGLVGGVTVTIEHMPWLWPAALELTSLGDVVAGLFTRHNPASYTFTWRQHESRTAVYSFFSGLPLLPIPNPAEVSRRLESPLIGRLADYRAYSATGAVKWRLVDVAEQQAVYAFLGLPHEISLPNEPLNVLRHLPAGLAGGGNNHESIERLLLGEFLRTGAGGQWHLAMDQALYKSEWQILRSDNFSHEADPGANNEAVPHSTAFAGDDEHRYRDGIALAYWLTGDQRFKDALLDEVEILPTRPVWAHERSMYQMIRALVAVSEFADAQAVLDPHLRERLEYFCTPTLDVQSATSGWGWDAAPGTGLRGYFANSSQNVSEKEPGESFVTRGFITATLGPTAMYQAARHFGLTDPHGDLADRRLLDLANYTREELFPWFANPGDRHLTYSYGIQQQHVNSWEISDFHPILVAMVGAWSRTGNLGYLKKGVEQLQAFHAHGNLDVLDGRLEAQLFCATVLDLLDDLGIVLPAP